MNKFFRIVVSSLFLCVSSVFADIERVSVSSSGEQANSVSNGVHLSSDGRYVLFFSFANNLVPQDTNDSYDVFVHDRVTSATERVSISTAGDQANSGSSSQGLSPDGRYVLFNSIASNLVPQDTNAQTDVFMHDRQTGVTERVSVSSTGVQANNRSTAASLGSDGRYIAFDSTANNLIVGDTNGRDDIFVHDRVTGETERVSVTSTGVQANHSSNNPSISADGNLVAFYSFASNLVVGDTNGRGDIFVHNRLTGETERVSISSAGGQANSGSNNAVISANGRFVAFESYATNLVPEDTNNRGGIFVHDLLMGITERVNVSSLDEQGNPFFESDELGGLSADGRFVAFESSDSILAPGDTNNKRDTYVRDRQTRMTERVSVSNTKEEANDRSYNVSLSADGRYMAFASDASNLVANDSNNARDIFVNDNPLANAEKLIVEKQINNRSRKTLNTSAQLSTGTLYKQLYKVTNSTDSRVYQVQIFEDGNLICNLYALDPGESKQGCISFQSVLDGDQHTEVIVKAKASGSSEMITGNTDAYYKGYNNAMGMLELTYTVNNTDADSANRAFVLRDRHASFQFKIKNIGAIELYGVKAYHDPVSPVNNGWNQQCVIGVLKPGQVRYCRRDITLSESGLNQAMGRVQGRNAIRSATDVVNASNSTYYIVP